MWACTLSQLLFSLGCTRVSALTVMYLLQCKSRVSQSKVWFSKCSFRFKSKISKETSVETTNFCPISGQRNLLFLRREAGFLRSPHRFSQRFVNPCQILHKPGLRFRNTVKTDFFFLSPPPIPPPALLLLVLARIRKSRGSGKKNREKDDVKIFKCQTSSVWALGKSLGWLLMYTKLFVPSLPLSSQALLPTAYTRDPNFI